MKFRKATEADIDSIMEIINQAQTWFKERGINQWQNNYPNPEIIKKDIDNSYGYILLKDNVVVSYVALIFDGEITYNSIYNGEWISNDKYAVIHRMAVESGYKGQGLASVIFNYVEELCYEKKVHSIKVDTHEDNIPMQKLLYKNGFQYCGIIYLEDKSKRIAFEKILIKGA
ncbi:MAG: GNAT family N-acetyltransferase [Gottschalkiaceae bacterium]|nr:MAG: GNAT family N-acetyltransferase [Gottschalkiaceae bacterium]